MKKLKLIILSVATVTLLFSAQCFARTRYLGGGHYSVGASYHSSWSGTVTNADTYVTGDSTADVALGIYTNTYDPKELDHGFHTGNGGLNLSAYGSNTYVAYTISGYYGSFASDSEGALFPN